MKVKSPIIFFLENVIAITMIYSVLLNTGKSMLKMMKTLWKNSLIIAKDIQILHVNFIVIALIFPEEKM
jgi:hypothetical protein